MTKLKIGQMVTYHQAAHEKPYNGHRDHPAIVTGTWGHDSVNLKVFFDCGPVEDRTSVTVEGRENPNSFCEVVEDGSEASS